MKSGRWLWVVVLCVVASVLVGASAFAQQAAAPAAPAEVFGPAPVAQNEQPGFLSALVSMLPMLAICYLIFYFMVVKPQEAKAKSHKSMIEGLKRGTDVVTSGGLCGRVALVEGEHVTLEVAPNVKVKVELAHIVKQIDKVA